MNILPPNNKLSLLVTEEFLDIIKEDYIEMLELCKTPMGNMGGAYAISNQQVSDTPFKFFVIRESGRVICNPEIINHTKTTVDSEEYCLTFFMEREPVIVQRWNVIEVKFQELIASGLIEKTETLRGKEARVWQHELDHCNGELIYDKDSDVWKAYVKFNELNKK